MRYWMALMGLALVLTGCGGDDSEKSSDDATVSALDDAIPACSGDPWTNFSVSGIDQPTPDSEAYVIPSSTQRSDLASSLQSFRDEDYESAVTSGEDAAYELCRSDSTVGPLVFWLPKTAGEGHARWVIRANDNARPLMVEATHGFFEFNTMKQAGEMFRALDARALIVNAGRRCANQTASGCSGTTSVCGTSDEPFRESDMAHTVESFFQVAHREIAQAYTNTWTVNLHGMSRDGFSLSNGTTNDTEADSPVALLYNDLKKQFPNEAVTTCNAFGGVAATNHLCGTTNVQGRLLNGSAEACTESASTASDRFIHLEQNRSIRDSETRREKVTQAFDAILPQ